MRKTYSLVHPKIKVPRLIDAAKHDVKKYLRRERNKQLPKGADYWDFDCKYGANQEEAREIHVKEINKCIDEAFDQGLSSFYLEILAKPENRKPREELDFDFVEDEQD